MESKLGGGVEEDVGWDIVGGGGEGRVSVDMWSASARSALTVILTVRKELRTTCAWILISLS